MHRLVLTALAIGLLGGVLLASCGPTRTCSTSTCTGCCQPSGECRSGFDNSACGTGARMCSTCGLGQTCLSGACSTTGSGAGTATGGGVSGTGGGTAAGGGTTSGGGAATGGGAGTGGGAATGGGSATAGGSAGCSPQSCPTGCCASGQCQTPSNSRCGANGSMCTSCPGMNTCVGGTCTPCTGCVDVITGVCAQGTSNSQCGARGQFCADCAQSAQTCQSGACRAPPTCNAQTCPSGCCDSTSGACVPPGSQTSQQCGQGSPGALCIACRSGSCNTSTGTCTAGSDAGTGFDGGFPTLPDGGLPGLCLPGLPISSCAVGECCFNLSGLGGLCLTIGNPNLLGGTTCGISRMDCSPTTCMAPQTCNATVGRCQ